MAAANGLYNLLNSLVILLILGNNLGFEASSSLLQPRKSDTQDQVVGSPGVECQGSCLTSAACKFYGGLSQGGDGACTGASVCCNFEFTCGQNSSELISIFQSPNYPSLSNQSAHCAYTLRTMKGVSSLRLDFLDVQMAPPVMTSTSQHKRCLLDSFVILNNKNEPNEPMCGFYGYSFLVDVSENSPIVLLFVMQSQSWKWRVRVKQIVSNMTKPWTDEKSCGKQLMYEESTSKAGDNEDDEKNNRISSFVVQGEDAEPNEFPWQVSLQSKSGSHRCGGSIINRQHILTAAHCFYTFSYSENSAVKVVAGISNLTETGEHIQSIEVESVILNYDYKPFMIFAGDVAILKLKTPLTYSAYVQPVCLHNVNRISAEYDLEDADVIATGWGYTNGDGDMKSQLQKLEMEVINNTICETEILEQMGRARHENGDYLDIFEMQRFKLCAGAKDENGTLCFGDSGGPLVAQHHLDATFTQVGIVSYGIGRCIPGHLVVFSRVSEFLEFISIATSN